MEVLEWSPFTLVDDGRDALGRELILSVLDVTLDVGILLTPCGLAVDDESITVE